MNARLARCALLALVLVGPVQGCHAKSSEPAAVTVGVAPAAASPAPVANSGPLVPPAGFMLAVVQSEKDARECPTDAVPFTAPLDFPSRYEGSGKSRDEVNDEAEKQYKTMTAPITALERGLSGQVDDYMRSGRAESLGCALGLLRAWSSAQALMGEAKTHTGKSMRKWAMGSIAGAYLRLKFSASRPLERDPDLQRSVDAWLGAVGTRVMAEWRDAPLEKMNNHEYWAAWAAMATGVALDRRDLFDWSLQQFGVAMSQVDAEGYLPNELARETRALWYHNYALTPLSMIAAFAKANGVPPDAQAQAALSRLGARVLAGVDDPAAFRDKTGKKQVVKDFDEKSKFAWLEPFCWTFTCTPEVEHKLDEMRPLKSYRLGGNLTEIFHPQQPDDAKRATRAADSRPIT